MATETIQYQWDDPVLKKQISLAAPVISACDIEPLDAWDTFLPVMREPHGPSYSHIAMPTLKDGGLIRISERVKLLTDSQSFGASQQRMPEGEIADCVKSRQIKDTAMPLLAQKIESKIVQHILDTATPCPSRHSTDNFALDSLAEMVMNPSGREDAETTWSYNHLTFLCHPLALKNITIPKWAGKQFRTESAPPAVITTPHMPPPSKTQKHSIPCVEVLCIDLTGLVLFISPATITAVCEPERWEIEASARCITAIWDFARPQPGRTELLAYPPSHSRT